MSVEAVLGPRSSICCGGGDSTGVSVIDIEFVGVLPGVLSKRSFR